MPNGWFEFLGRVTQLESNQADPRAIWSEFLQLSQTSPHAEGLQILAKSVQKLPIDDRGAVAIVVTALLAPLEWPPEWEQHRIPLVEALESLVRAMDLAQPDSLPALLNLEPDEKAHHKNGRFMLASATELLRTPCRRDQLPICAHLCSLGHHSCLRAYRRALARSTEESRAGPLLEAQMKLAASSDRYVQAARALNSAVGEVLFKTLDERLEMPGT